MNDPTSTRADAQTDDSRRGYDLRDYVRMLRSYWLGTLICLLLAVTASAAWTLTQPREYTSTASGVVQVATSGDANLSFAADQLAKSQAESYVELGKSLAVARRAASTVGAPGSAAALLSSVTATLADNTAIITVDAHAATPDRAAALATAWIDGMGKQIESMQAAATGANGLSTTKFVPLASASVPSAPSSPNVTAAVTVGTLAGVVLAFLYLLVRNTFDRRIRSADMLERETGVSVLGTIPLHPMLLGEHHLVATLPQDDTLARHRNFAMLESLRELRTNLSYVHVDAPARSIVVTSAQPGDGKSTLAANLAEAMAASTSGRVVILDCDLRRPTISTIFGVSVGAGLTDVLAGRARLADVMQQTDVAPNLWVIGTGRIPPNPSELLGSESMRSLLRTLAEHAVVILDAPPVLAVTDAAVLAAHTDGVLITVSAKRTTVDLLRRTVQLLGRGGGTVLGAVLNRVPIRGADAREYGYYGGAYYYGDEERGGDDAPTPAEPAAPPSGADTPPRSPVAAGATIGFASEPAPGTTRRGRRARSMP
ncbi:polysaccharide biosynthesis tyrosine autokinase [Curtobacterium ammoniigenes]|uniref:polysaccharide biosynthesis tyrosine autokinase n=1 Tax=Curtobacterium ammoniigenes TaxID=395387 RepID=UPI000AC9B31D|nr:polysaccharide biosynthesis tyrosine autokinase [Curtobacterium ammoniigenes]